MQVDTTVPADRQRDPRAPVRAAEERGYDGAWLSEVKHDPLVGIALAATASERIELGSSVAVAFARNPMSCAVVADDLQAITGGRLLLGLGTQVRAHVTRRFGMPWSHPAARMREYVLAMRAIWRTWHTGEPLDFAGDFYTHTLMTPMFVPEPHDHGPPRVLLAAVGPAMTEVAGEVADGLLPHGFTTERYLREVTLPALGRGLARAGRPEGALTVCGSPMVVTGSTPELRRQADRRTRAQIAFYGSTPAYRPVLELHGWGDLGAELHTLSTAGRWDDMSDLIDDDVLETFAVVAEPDEVAGKVASRYGDLLDRVTLTLPHEDELAGRIADALRTSAPA
ncbi:LLM class oxidoreductase [Jatrophihabitans fulvus]